MANMDDELEEHCILCGENYGSGCFRATAKIDGSDWTDEIHDTVPDSVLTRWNEVIDFVMNSTDEEFKAGLSNYFYVDSLIHYHLFGLASCGFDAYGKNQLYMTYDGQKWIACMYDMDATWGLYWNGSKFVATDYARTSYEDYVSSNSSCTGNGNLLYNRLEECFHEELQARWAEVRSGALSIENVINRFERFTDIVPPELVEEDYANTTGGGSFTGIPSRSTNNIKQIRTFALARRTWTDEYVAALTGENGGESGGEDSGSGETEITLSSISATYSGGDVTVGTAVTDLTGIVVTAHYSDGSTASVTDYTLSGEIAEGSNTITVSYGGKTTTFTVTGYVAVVDDGIDYTVNALDSVTWTTNADFDDAGNEITAENHCVSSKFTLQDVLHKIVVGNTDSQYVELHVWDENNNYVGAWEWLKTGTSTKFEWFIPVPGYKFAVRMYNANGTVDHGVSVVPIDNRTTAAGKCEINLAELAWYADGTNIYACEMTELFADLGIGITPATTLRNANVFIHDDNVDAIWQGGASVGYFGINPWGTQIWMQYKANDSAITDVNALISYFEQNNMKLILNA